jgi:membrane-associated HD superfamily phosphohydrolase
MATPPALLYFDTQAHKHASLVSQGGFMPLINIVLVLIVVGVLLWLINRFIPMQGTIKSILNAVVVIGVVLWLLDTFGLFHSLSRIRVGT